MGQRSASESIIRIIQAFLGRRTWKQADLAAHLGLRVPALRSRLDELSRAGVPLERDPEPPHVYWSVPSHWFPGAVALSAADAEEMLRQLSRAPEGRERDGLLLALAQATGRHAEDREAAIGSPQHTEDESRHLRTIEDSATAGGALRLRYHSAHRKHVDVRHVSVQRVFPGERPYFLAYCHRSGALKFFRVARIVGAHMADDVTFQAVAPDEVEAFLATSATGFRDAGEPVDLVFFVRDPEARWVKDSLPVPADAEPCDGGLRFRARTAALTPLARFLVGLGDAVRAESDELVEAVTDLAKGALKAHGASLPIRSVVAIRSTVSSLDTA